MFVQAVEDRQGMQISCLEEIAHRMGYINDDQLQACIKELAGNEYGQYLLRYLEGLRK